LKYTEWWGIVTGMLSIVDCADVFHIKVEHGKRKQHYTIFGNISPIQLRLWFGFQYDLFQLLWLHYPNLWQYWHLHDRQLWKNFNCSRLCDK